jgi:hypothetical protein
VTRRSLLHPNAALAAPRPFSWGPEDAPSLTVQAPSPTDPLNKINHSLPAMTEPKPLHEYKDLLLKSTVIKQLVAEHYGPTAKEQMKEFAAGNMEDLLELIEEKKQELSASPKAIIEAAAPDDDVFEIRIWAAGPVCWIEANEFDDIGYFSSLKEAEDYVSFAFEGPISALAERDDATADDDKEKHDDTEDDDAEDDDAEDDDAEDDDTEDEDTEDEDTEDEGTEETVCPFCQSADSCEHHLLSVDTTFRETIGGALFKEFAEVWGELYESDDLMDEDEAFDELLEEISELADSEEESDFEGGPGQSSATMHYYCSSAERIRQAMQAFRKKHNLNE